MSWSRFDVVFASHRLQMVRPIHVYWAMVIVCVDDGCHLPRLPCTRVSKSFFNLKNGGYSILASAWVGTRPVCVHDDLSGYLHIDEGHDARARTI